jgi:DUF1009 family protein
VAEAARAAGYGLAVAALEGEAEPRLAELADRFLWLPLGQFQAMADFFQAAGVRDLVMIGGVDRETILFHYEPDEAFLDILAGLKDFHTDRLLSAVAARLEALGLRLKAVADLLPELPAPPGFLTSRRPDADLTADLQVAWRIAKELGRLDVGQTAVVSDRITLAAEAAEGTDAAVARGAALAGKPVAVAKVVKPAQDVRLDPPVIGPETIRVMARAKVGALAVEAGRVLIIDREETVRLAEEAGLALVAWTDELAGYRP